LKNKKIEITSFYEECPIKQAIDSIDHNFMAQSKRNQLYQQIYFGFALLFLLLGALVLFKTPSWASGLYFHNYELVKTFTYTLCFSLSLGAFGLTYAIESDVEITENMITIFKKKLERIYKELRLAHPDHPSFRQYYQETKEKIERKKKKTIDRLVLIKQASTLNSQTKEELAQEIFNDLQFKLKNILHYFRDSINSIQSSNSLGVQESYSF
jgi:hypothetical protein